jgi:hypothetical protein
MFTTRETAPSMLAPDNVATLAGILLTSSLSSYLEFALSTSGANAQEYGIKPAK